MKLTEASAFDPERTFSRSDSQSAFFQDKDRMNVLIDSSKYDKYQLFFVRKLCEMLIADLQRAGIDDEIAEELATQIAFTMCCLTDGSTILEMDGKPFLPCLTFSQDDDYAEVLSSGGGSWMHEYVGGTVWDVFHEEE